MNVFTSNKIVKKLIIALVVLILFNFCYPKNVKAGLNMDDIVAAPALIFWLIEENVLVFLNDLFTNDDHKVLYTEDPDDEFHAKEMLVYLTPESIIKGKFILFDADIFKEITKEKANEYYDYVEGGSVSEGKKELRETIAGWYYSLRNFAIVALLSVLVYVGIRMIMSTVAQDKAKYKLMFKDWLVALCLLVVMHYLMIGILNITSMVTDAIGGGNNNDMVRTLSRRISGILSENYDEAWTWNDSYKYVDSENGQTYTIGDAYAYILVMAGVIWYTFVFAIKYLKREFTIVFLILLGPVSCITYPIDKISDGKAQAFNRWFAEFLYQVIIQPFHLLLYIVLVSSAIELADANVIYTLVCFAIMIPAEKFVKEMFGFKDKLGSPLGAFAGGALASKMLSSLGGKKGGSGGTGGGNQDNNSTEEKLTPKTVDDPPIEGGDEKFEDTNIRQNENNQMESETTGNGNASEEENPENEEIRQNENDELKEDATGEDTRSTNSNEPTQQSGSGAQQNKSNLFSRMAAIHNQRAAKKWGSTSRGRRWVNRGKKLAGKTARFAAVGAGAATLGAFGVMTGNGAAGVATGAMLGSRLGNRVIKRASGFVATAKDYGRAFSTPEKREAKVLERFKADSSQIDKAVLSYRERHDGVDPNDIALDKEMESRFELSRYGLSDDQIDKAIGTYTDIIDKEGISADIAAMQTVYASQLAADYSKKDFRSEKTMKEAVETISRSFQERGVSKQVADANARKYLQRAATIKKTEIALPSTNKTIDIKMPNAKVVASSLGVNSSNMETVHIERINNITARLHHAGYSEAQIKQIATDSRGGTTVEILDRYEARVEYLNSDNAIEEAKMTIEARNGGDYATKQQLQAEMGERLVLRETFDFKNEKELSAMRDLEETTVKSKSQKEVARLFAIENRGKLNNEAHMAGAKRDLINKLMQGGASSDKAIKDADNIINLAFRYNNEIKQK